MLQEFTTTILALRQFEETHKDVFNEYNQLLELKGKQEMELKNWAKENGDADNGIIKVSKIRKWKKWLDWANFSPKSKKLIKDAGGLIEKEPEVNREVVEQLAKDEKISREEIVKCYHEEEMSPAIAIKILLPTIKIV